MSSKEQSVTNRVRLPQQPWFGDQELEIEFPSTWEVKLHHMRGHDRRPLDEEGLRRAFANPVGTRPIRELARGKRTVAIIFDDMARPTRISQIVPYVLEELAAAGVPDQGVQFIVALGTHGAHTLADFEKKLGRQVVARYPVYNHNPFGHCLQLGTTSRGTPVAVNAEVMRCDLKIGIGCIVPHPITGYGGGAKIILPGVAAIETIAANHSRLVASSDPGQGPNVPIMGRYEANEARLDMEETAAMAGLDVKVDAVLSLRRDIVGLFVGEAAAELAEGVKLAAEVFATEPADENVQVVVANTYAKANEAMLAMRREPVWLSDEVDLVVIADAPEGQVTHYLFGPFGAEGGGLLWTRRDSLAPGVRRVFMVSAHPELAATYWFGPADKVFWRQSWAEVLLELQRTYPTGARAAVFPDLTVQYCPA